MSSEERMLLKGKVGVILGVANKRSIAWAIAKRAAEEGAELVLTYQNDRLRENVEGLAGELSQKPLLLPCDVSDEAQIDALFEGIRQKHAGLDFVVHALAFARREELEGAFLNTAPEGFQIALGISAYSLVAIARRAVRLMEGRKGSFLTLTYLGSERAVANYNVMGVAKAALEASVRYLAVDVGPMGHRVNAVSAGPIKTLAASGVSGFSRILDVVKEKAPLRRNVDALEVADASVFFLSELSRGVTGEVLFVDSGFHAVGF
jgi:enoyl-[acyl-carrier protein] reductase I